MARWLHQMKTSFLYMQTTTCEGFLGGRAVYSPNMTPVTLRMSTLKNVVPVFSTLHTQSKGGKKEKIQKEKKDIQ